ncbi:E3 ubiquitin-protein ligase TRIM39-like [Mobula hypostoma]|uniref:E3 ubiquitin-protein ligase TRIM39-like n=1 Tax=Mobula hypostoma TaxID=723540 RepID=UPI002FC2BF2F
MSDDSSKVLNHESLQVLKIIARRSISDQSMLESQTGDLQKHMSLIQNNIKFTANSIIEVNDATARLLMQLSQKYRNMIATLKRAEEETMSIVKGKEMKLINSLNESMSNHEKEAQEVQSVIDQLSSLSKSGGIYQIVQAKQDISTSVQAVLKKPLPKVMTIKLDDNFRGLTEAANKLESKLVEFLLQKWARNITLDAETSHPTLEITAKGKAVSVRENPLVVPPNPKRFTHVTIVLASEGFNTGKHYWEVTVQDKSNWSVGVVKESMPRNENSNLMNSPWAWSVASQQPRYLAWHNSMSTPLNVSQLQKLGVFLDYEAGQVVFYDASTMAQLYTFSETFAETIYPAFNPGNSSNKEKNATLIIHDVGSG